VGKRECAEGAGCALHPNGTHYCLCPLGKAGLHCDEAIVISDPKFDGEDSVLSLKVDSALRYSSHFAVSVRVSEKGDSDGVLLHVGQGQNSGHDDFFSLTLRNASVVLVMNLGGPSIRQDRIVSLSLCCVQPNVWTRIEAGRTGGEAYLALEDGQRAVGSSPLGLSSLDVDNVIHLGEEERQEPEAETLLF